MARLQHLLQEDSAPIYQLDFGDRVTQTVAQVVAQEAVQRLAPAIQQLANEIQSGGDRLEESARAATGALEAAEAALSAAVKEEVGSLQKDLRKAVSAITRAQAGESEALRDGLIKALSRVRIPDYSDQLGQVQAMQQMIMAAVQDGGDEDDPKEWEFTVNRNSRGFIQTVTAKAK